MANSIVCPHQSLSLLRERLCPAAGISSGAMLLHSAGKWSWLRAVILQPVNFQGKMEACLPRPEPGGWTNAYSLPTRKGEKVTSSSGLKAAADNAGGRETGVNTHLSAGILLLFSCQAICPWGWLQPRSPDPDGLLSVGLLWLCFWRPPWMNVEVIVFVPNKGLQRFCGFCRHASVSEKRTDDF